MISKIHLLAVVFSLIVIACSSPQPEQDSKQVEQIIITRQQMAAEEMEIGKGDSSSFDTKVHFTGSVEPSVNGYAQIFLPVPGIISAIFVEPGQQVQKGQAIAEISGAEFIDLQQQYFSSKAKSENLQAGYDRARQLFDEKISSLRDFKAAEAEYLSEKANAQALQKKLHLLGISTENLTDGTIRSSYRLKAPIAGKLSSLSAVLGAYTNTNSSVGELIDDRSYRIRLDIFENDIYQLNVNQVIDFNLNAKEPVQGTAKLVAIGELVNAASKTVSCYAIPEPKLTDYLVGNQYIEGDITVNSEMALSLPESALVKHDQHHFIYLVDKEENDSIYLSKYPVETGRLINGRYEIKSALPEKMILLKGAFNL